MIMNEYDFKGVWCFWGLGRAWGSFLHVPHLDCVFKKKNCFFLVGEGGGGA